MIPKINKILYATDLSPNSAYAFGYAMDCAIRHDASVTILHVVAKKHDASVTISHVLEQMLGDDHARMISHFSKDRLKKISENSEAYVIDEIRTRLNTFCDRELKDDPQCMDRIVSIDICAGYPAEEILRKADELNCDAIIMGTHGKGAISHTFLGSVAQKVLRRVKKPVFIIPLPTEGN